MWRPKGWEARKTQWQDDLESGASAMLVALRESGHHITIGQTLEIEGEKIVATKNVTLVLIPDEK